MSNRHGGGPPRLRGRKPWTRDAIEGADLAERSPNGCHEGRENA
jgi:hypothetical protein